MAALNAVLCMCSGTPDSTTASQAFLSSVAVSKLTSVGVNYASVICTSPKNRASPYRVSCADPRPQVALASRNCRRRTRQTLPDAAVLPRRYSKTRAVARPTGRPKSLALMDEENAAIGVERALDATGSRETCTEPYAGGAARWWAPASSSTHVAPLRVNCSRGTPRASRTSSTTSPWLQRTV